MKFIELRNDQAATGLPCDGTNDPLQLTFYTRLREDRLQLVALGTKLSESAGNAAQAFEELRTFAHRLCGAAAIFGATEIRNAARTLEVASEAAQEDLTSHEDTRVWSALALLADLLASVTDLITTPALTLAARRRSNVS